jgi:uncharacterized metal-binding protein YceD (DUF177 family)
MHPLVEYQIPVKGLKSGSHRFVLKAGEVFFEHFQNSIIESGNFNVALDVERHPDWMKFDFHFSGYMDTECDRCLAAIKLPVERDHTLIVKMGEENADEDIDVIFIPEETTNFDISQLVYELLVLSVPLVKVYDCQSETDPPCNFQLLQKLEGNAGKEGDNPFSDPTWDILKDIQ